MQHCTNYDILSTEISSVASILTFNQAVQGYQKRY